MSTASITIDGSEKTLRGQNKPKCAQCGNVARSRCPFHSCKSCCSKAQNPCHIHVLKSNGSLQEKTLSANSPLGDLQSTEVPPSGASHRVASLRQLSSNFSQFNNLHIPHRSRKPLSRKDATAINEWRFSKLKDYKDGNMEREDEAFERYMRNIGLLEEVFLATNPNPNPNPNSPEEMILKRRRRSGDNGLQEIMYPGLSKAKASGSESVGLPENTRTERGSGLDDLIEKLKKARNEEDLESCLKMKSEVFRKTIDGEREEGGAMCAQKFECPPPLMARPCEVDRQILGDFDIGFDSLQRVAHL